MLKKAISTKGVLFAGLVMMSLQGCGNSLAEQDSTGTAVYEEELSGNQEIARLEQADTDNASNNTSSTLNNTPNGTSNASNGISNTSNGASNAPNGISNAPNGTSNSTEAEVPAKEETSGTAISETKETAAKNEPLSQQQAETSVALTDKGKSFLTQMCRELNDFNSGAALDEKFWRDFLFYSYTGASSENTATEQIYREDLGFEETVVKVSLQEAEGRAKLVFGVALPDFKPSFEDMGKGQTSFYYKDGYYYIGVSDLPDYQYTFSECVADKENAANTIVKFTADFMGESNVGTVTFTISPENNENGFVICSKATEFVK